MEEDVQNGAKGKKGALQCCNALKIASTALATLVPASALNLWRVNLVRRKPEFIDYHTEDG